MFALPLFRQAFGKLVQQHKANKISHVLVFGSAGSGKSTMIKSLVENEDNQYLQRLGEEFTPLLKIKGKTLLFSEQHALDPKDLKKARAVVIIVSPRS